MDGGTATQQPLRDIPLSVKYETKRIWRAASDAFGVGPTGAAIAVALFEAAMIGGALTSYSRSKDYYAKRKRHPLMGYRKVVGSVDMLEAGGWIENRKQLPGWRGLQSSMLARPALVTAMAQILADTPRLPILKPNRTILLRDRDGFDMDVRPSRDVDRMNRRMLAINEAITSADVFTQNGVPLSCPVVRIFNVDPNLRRGGRMYAAGTSWQNIPKADRGRITIDGEAVVEIDFATLHPALLYAEVGAALPRDCYSIGDWGRGHAKIALLTLINAPTMQSARLSLAHNLDFSPVPPGSQEALLLASRLIEDIKRTHRSIAAAFHSDAGARLMRQDSELAIAVVSTLQKQGVLVLPIHDSFLVPVSKRDALEAAMLAAAHAIGLGHIRVLEVPIATA